LGGVVIFSFFFALRCRLTLGGREKKLGNKTQQQQLKNPSKNFAIKILKKINQQKKKHTHTRLSSLAFTYLSGVLLFFTGRASCVLLI
jgi:hypothetical protein